VLRGEVAERPGAARDGRALCDVHHRLVPPIVYAALADWASLAVAVAAVIVAALAYTSDRFFRTRDGVGRLLERFETGDLHVLVWRMERVTRPEGKKASALDRVDSKTLRAGLDANAKAVFDLMVAKDWTRHRAGMHEVYFFALRVHAWLMPSRLGAGRRVRLLNATFGFQLLSTLLDHRTIALRLRDEGRSDWYFPTQYGCLDVDCESLVDQLAADLLSDDRELDQEIARELRMKWDTTRSALAERRADRTYAAKTRA
jgi:hypothetical protein